MAIMPSVGRSEHLDLFEKGIARKLDFSFSGTQSLRISQLLEDGLPRNRRHPHLYRTLLRLYVDLSPNVALIAGYKADRKGNLYTGPSTEDTLALVEAAAFHDGIVIAQVNELVDDEWICRASIFPARGSITWWAPTSRSLSNRFFTRDPRLIGRRTHTDGDDGDQAHHAGTSVQSLNHGIGFNIAAIELLLLTHGEQLGLKGKIGKH